MTESSNGSQPRVLLLGATGTIGMATATTLISRGYQVTCPLRLKHVITGTSKGPQFSKALRGCDLLTGDLSDFNWLSSKVFAAQPYDAVISCLASRNGEPKDAWRVDYQINSNLLKLARHSGVKHFVLLSAICVQKPKLAFQQAKLAFEKELAESGLTYSIDRPTAYFKSLSGQVARVQAGKPFLVFGDGKLTACKPISDHDLANFLVDCLEQEPLQNRILPIGGPGPAQTPRQQAEQLFDLLGLEPKFKSVPPALLGTIAACLGFLGKFIPPLASKAELARIGLYYATESMLVMDPETGNYQADLTPETGSDRLLDYHRSLIEGNFRLERGEHAVFREPRQSQ